ncbi:related to cupin domain protein [Rhynchosporium agropyri]|uniref:Related to cupin domain protein n=2 Tax=Rhynchosporium TaxID=38037 RepID=A0A1E1LL66_9HELO|nr:related to cupin domain protein [Rhynchosporium agropyri]CZT12044.1 related to cupin domain protein [Rhynchosporium commune]
MSFRTVQENLSSVIADQADESMLVTFPPNCSTPPHTHPTAFVAVSVLSGHVFNKMNDNPMTIFGPGEVFFEGIGCRHRISDNASETEEAKIVATMVLDTKVLEEKGIQGILNVDEEWREIFMSEIVKRNRAA